MTPFTLAVIAIRLLALYIFVVNFLLGAVYYVIHFAMEIRNIPTSDWSLSLLQTMGVLQNLGYCGAYLVISVVLYLNSVAIAARLSRGLELPATPPDHPQRSDPNP
ncbi:MAG: hypothetical protein JNL50_09650 [Phycisphaerae bacterium]|nr:hypothetical protein [Phycisphaerae bacterium]